MPELSDDTIREIADALCKSLTQHVPEWTDGNQGDPGVTLLELFAFIVNSLSARQDAISREDYIASLQLARMALRLAQQSSKSEAGALARNNYFSGRLLSAEDFALEQNYIRERFRRLNRELHGAGIARGLEVSVVQDGACSKIMVQPGVAIDPYGEEIEVTTMATVCLPDGGTRLWVILSHRERPTRPVPGLEGDTLQFTRIEEAFEICLEAEPNELGVTLAGLLRDGSGWRTDEAFMPQRISCART